MCERCNSNAYAKFEKLAKNYIQIVRICCFRSNVNSAYRRINEKLFISYHPRMQLQLRFCFCFKFNNNTNFVLMTNTIFFLFFQSFPILIITNVNEFLFCLYLRRRLVDLDGIHLKMMKFAQISNKTIRTC